MSVQIFKLTNGKFIIADRLFSTDRALSERAPLKLKNAVVINAPGEFTEKMTNLPLSTYLPFAEDNIIQLFEKQVESFAEVNKALKERYESFVKSHLTAKV